MLLYHDGLFPKTITLLRSIRVFSGTHNISRNIPHIKHELWDTPQNALMDMDNVMTKVVVIE